MRQRPYCMSITSLSSLAQRLWKLLRSHFLMAGRDRFWACGANRIWVNKIALKKMAVSDFPRNFFLAENFLLKIDYVPFLGYPKNGVSYRVWFGGHGSLCLLIKCTLLKANIHSPPHIMYLGCIIYAIYCSNNNPSRSKHTNPLHIAYTMIVPW